MSNDVELISRINWNGLSCFERAMCFAAMSFNKRSIYAFLLLKMGYRNCFENETKYAIASDEYYHKVLDSLGLDFERNYCEYDDLLFEIEHSISSGEYVVCCVDIFNIPDTKDYRVKHHPHFIAVKEIRGDKAVIIDEDWSKCYWNKENCKNGVLYLEKTISINELISYCYDFHACFQPCPNGFSSYISVFKTGKEMTDKNHILKEYLRSINRVLNNDCSYFDAAVSVLYAFYGNFENHLLDLEQRYAKSDNIRSTQTQFILKNRYIYPYELEVVACHHFFLESQLQALELLFDLTRCYSKLESDFEGVIKGFDLIKLFVAKDLFDKNPKHRQLVIEQCKKCSALEKKLYDELSGFLTGILNDLD